MVVPIQRQKASGPAGRRPQARREELGATVPARGMYVIEPEFGNLDAIVAAWADTAVPLIRRALAA